MSYSQWSDRDLVTAKTAASLPHVESAIREIQRESRQFQLLALRELGVRTPQLGKPVEIYPRSRVDALDVYRRPARDASRVLESGGSLEEAWKAFADRLEGIIEADAAIAERDEIEFIQDRLEDADLLDWQDEESDEEFEEDADSDLMDYDEMLEYLGAEQDPKRKGRADTDGGPKVIGYRRVVRPELSMHGPCGLCVVAATNWYTKSSLQGIHHLCKCVTLPVTADQDPGFRWNQEDLRRHLDTIYGAAGGSTRGKDLKRVRVKITEHGELGPILEWRAKNGWTRKSNFVAHRPKYIKPTTETQRERLHSRRAELAETIARLRASLSAGGNRDGTERAIWEVEQSIRDIDVKLSS